jgi:hypothetical protein
LRALAPHFISGCHKRKRSFPYIILKRFSIDWRKYRSHSAQTDRYFLSQLYGGRRLDSVVTSIEALPEIVETIDVLCDVYIDSGIRRGTGIFKAFTLGAQVLST